MKTDLTYLKSLTSDSDNLVKEMIDIFISQVQEYKDEMKRDLEEQDWESLGKIAHKAKSSVAIMGMKELADELKTLELLARDKKETETYPEYVRKFNESCDEAVKELQSIDPKN